MAILASDVGLKYASAFFAKFFLSKYPAVSGNLASISVVLRKDSETLYEMYTIQIKKLKPDKIPAAKINENAVFIFAQLLRAV